MDPALLHVDQQLPEVAVVATVEVPHGELGGAAGKRLGGPKHLAKQRFELFSDVPRGLCVECGVLDPRRAGGETALEVLRVNKRGEGDDYGGNVDGFTLHPITLDVGSPEDLLVGTLTDVELLRETLQGVGTFANA